MKIKVELELDTESFEDKERIEKIIELLEKMRDQLGNA